MRGRQGVAAFENPQVNQRDEHRSTDDRHTAQRLHGDVHALELVGWRGVALRIHHGNGLYRHGIRDNVLQYITDGAEQGGEYEPRVHAPQRGHGLAMADEGRHDDQTAGNEYGT